MKTLLLLTWHDVLRMLVIYRKCFVPVVGAVVSDTAARFDWWLQVHTVVTNVTSKVSLQAWHNWTAVCCFALSKVVISTKAVHVLVALWTWLYTAVLEDHVTEYGISFHAFANDTQLYIACCQHLLPANTRGNHYKLQNHTFHYDFITINGLCPGLPG